MNRIFFKTDINGVQQLPFNIGRDWKFDSYVGDDKENCIVVAWNNSSIIKDYQVEERSKKIMDNIESPFERITYEEALAYGKEIITKQIDIDGNEEALDFDFGLDPREEAEHIIFGGVEVEEGVIVDTKLHDLLTILTAYTTIKFGDATEIKVDAKDGSEFIINSSNATDILQSVLGHVELGKSKRNKNK